jgi:hypothetical protein
LSLLDAFCRRQNGQNALVDGRAIGCAVVCHWFELSKSKAPHACAVRHYPKAALGDPQLFLAALQIVLSLRR